MFKRLMAFMLMVVMTVGSMGIQVFAEVGEWEELPSMEVGRKFAISEVVDGKIYVVGNDLKDKTLEIYDISSGVWSQGSDIPLAVSGAASVAVNYKIYVMGGIGSPDNSGTNEYLSVTYIYDTLTDRWEQGPTLPEGSAYASAEMINNKIYYIGGLNNNGTNRMFIYDIISSQWSEGAPISSKKTGVSTVAIGSKIYLIQGNNSSETTENIEVYDSLNNTWSIGAKIPETRSYGTAEAVGNKIYLFGGRNDANELTNTIQIFDVGLNTWEVYSSMPIKNCFMTTGIYKNKIYVLGGTDITYSTSVYSYEIEINDEDNLCVLLETDEQTQLSLSQDLALNSEYIWSSEDEMVATVDTNGLVTAVGEGVAKIYAESQDGTFKEYISVKVLDQVYDELRLALDLNVGKSARLYLSDNEGIVWTSMDPSVATVDETGKVTAVKKGLAIIQTEDNGEIYKIYVRAR